MSQVLRIQKQLALLLLTIAQFLCAGWSISASAQTPPPSTPATAAVPPSSNPAAAAAAPPLTEAEIQRLAYIEERYPEIPEDMKKKDTPKGIAVLAPKNLKASYKKNVQGKGPDPNIARQIFATAEAEYEAANRLQGDERKAKLAVAAAKYAEAADRWPGSMLEEDAFFMAGEAYFFSDQYDKANKNYELLAKNHPNTRHMDLIDAHRFAIAQYWLDLDNVTHDSFFKLNFYDQKKPINDTSGHAFRVFDRIRIDDPTGKLSDDATLASANAHFARGHFLKADDLYTDLRKTYPNSEHQFVAHFLGLKAKLNSYMGPEYSGDCLNESEKLIKQIRKLFPAKAEEEKEFLVRAFAEIRYKRAERLWTIAHFHELKKEYGPANHYLEQILKDYPDTPFADKANERIPINAELPPVPPQRLQWFIDMFPKRQPAKPLLRTDDPALGK